MRVLLVHAADDLPANAAGKWDLVVDLGRSPRSTYDRWKARCGCVVKSINDFQRPLEDLRRVKELLRTASHSVLDSLGIDWWGLASYLVADDLLVGLRLRRLAKELGNAPELDCTRRDAQASVLRDLSGGRLGVLQVGSHLLSRMEHYREIFSRLDRTQIAQVLEDKWDPQHQLRRRMSRRRVGNEAVVILPTAYVNISRTAVAYAKLMPEKKFLLVYARNSGKIPNLPSNVHLVPLHPYYSTGEPRDLADLLARWEILKLRLRAGSEEFNEADSLGGLQRVPEFIRRGLWARDAWNEVFARHNVTGCLCADDTNVYTRLPLVIGQLRGISCAATHHGALDYRMAFKTLYGDVYLAKSEMELDYLVNVCQVAGERIVLGGPDPSPPAMAQVSGKLRPWLVFFTEPYDADGWRKDEIYRELLPELLALAERSGLQLVFKLHPFESAKGHRNLLSRWLSVEQCRQIEIVTGGLNPDFWAQVRVAITVQSSVAIECTRLGIPVFLCSWLGSRYGGYIQQFAKFGAGQILAQCEDLRTVPARLAGYVIDKDVQWKLGTAIDPDVLRHLLGVKDMGKSEKTLEVF